MNGYTSIFIVALVIPLAVAAIILSWGVFRIAASLSHHSFHGTTPAAEPGNQQDNAA